MNKLLLPTCSIKHCGLGGYSNILPRIKFGVTGQESSPQSPTISYCQPLPATLKTTLLRMSRQKNDIKASRTFSTFGFARHTSQRFAKPKEPLFCLRTTENHKFENY